MTRYADATRKFIGYFRYMCVYYTKLLYETFIRNFYTKILYEDFIRRFYPKFLNVLLLFMLRNIITITAVIRYIIVTIARIS